MTRKPAVHNRATLLAPALLMLTGCGAAPASEAPLSEEALAAVTDNAGAPKDQLARQVAELFTADGIGETRVVVVMANGKIAAERYGPGYDKEPRFVSWAMAKPRWDSRFFSSAASSARDRSAPSTRNKGS